MYQIDTEYQSSTTVHCLHIKSQDQKKDLQLFMVDKKVIKTLVLCFLATYKTQLHKRKLSNISERSVRLQIRDCDMLQYLIHDFPKDVLSLRKNFVKSEQISTHMFVVLMKIVRIVLWKQMVMCMRVTT